MAPEREVEAPGLLALGAPGVTRRRERVAPGGGALVVAEAPAAPRWELPAITLLALVVRLVHLDHPPHFDELYHALAARSWVEDGTLGIGEGRYTRASLFTILVGLFYQVLGDSLVVARLPSVLAGTLWVSALFLWTRREAGRLAGWAAALLLCLDPGAVNLSQQARFYAVHGLLFWLGAMAVYAAVVRAESRGAAAKHAPLAAAAFAAAALGVALHLQPTTLIGTVGLGCWAALVLAPRARDAAAPRWILLAAAGALVLAAAFLRSDTAADLWFRYRATALWATNQENNVRWYLEWLMERWPTLITLLPVAAVVALGRRWRFALLCLATFAAALALHSFAGFKQERFIYYALPFFFALWGVALGHLVPAFLGSVRRLLAPGGAWTAGFPGRAATAAIVAGTVLLLAYGNSALPLGVRMVFPEEGRRPYAEADWEAAAPLLDSLADSADVVVTSAGPKALYYLGRFDYGLSATELADYGREAPEFFVDRRTGRPLISREASLARVMACYRRGLAIVEEVHWGARWSVPPDAASFLATHADSVPVPPEHRLRVYRWSRPAPGPLGACPPTGG